MGLDMYLTGDKFACTQYARDDNGNILRDENGGIIPINEVFVDGFKRSSEKLSLGYWRKHAPLHQLIVDAFANGEDNCRPIDLRVEDLRWIASVLRGDASTPLPPNHRCGGFFFGNEEWWDEMRAEPEREHDARIFEKAADWLESGSPEEISPTQRRYPEKFWHSVEYQASW